MKTARDIMTKEVFTVEPSMSVKKLAALFTEKSVSGFPVIESGRLVGIVTESDLIHQNERFHIPTTVAIFDAVLLLGSSAKVEEELKRMTAATVGEIMTQNPLTIPPDATLSQMASFMGERHAHTLPVVDEGGSLLGVVGKRDLIRALAS